MRCTAMIQRRSLIWRSAVLLCFTLLAPPALAAQANALALPEASAQGVLQFTHAEAVRAGWDSAAPPSSGWTRVHLTDLWTTQWPRHNGVVWYRLRWNQREMRQPLGLLLDRVCQADAVYVNGSLIYRDAHLHEPLSRNCAKPEYFLLDRPLLDRGENTLLVRVTGYAAYGAGLGVARIGNPLALHAHYRALLWLNYNLRLFDITVDIVLAALFGILWLLRRHDTLYGWFALASLFGALFGWHYIAYSPWPFTNTSAWEVMSAALYLATAVAFAMFLLRYAETFRPRLERGLQLAAGLGLAAALLLPQWMGPHRAILLLAATLLFYVAILAFILHAFRRPRSDLVLPALCLLLTLLAGIHDELVRTGIWSSEPYLSNLTSPVTLIGICFVLAYRFSQAMRRVERFNLELAHEIETATDELRATLQREQALGVANARINERLNLVRDLHDGFGGSLLGAIAELESGPDDAVRSETAQVLRDLRDDLRLVIDTSTHASDCDLAELLAPLRHRCTQRLELAGIANDWHCDGLDGLKLDAARGLDLLRLLQEALTNVLKHSGATRVEVSLWRARARLQIEVRDDGRGFAVAADAPTHGAGLASLRARAARLGCALEILSEPGQGTCVRCAVEL